jgi:hypothetical protein
VTPDLPALARKYRALLELRQPREAAIALGLSSFPVEEGAPRREAMRVLAEEFPGALRELDDATAAELAARLRAIESALAGGPAERWMLAATLFHAGLREALRIRRGDEGALAFWSRDDLDGVRRPSSGRLLDVVWTAVADRLRISPREAERLVYPRAPARGARC